MFTTLKICYLFTFIELHHICSQAAQSASHCAADLCNLRWFYWLLAKMLQMFLTFWTKKTDNYVKKKPPMMKMMVWKYVVSTSVQSFSHSAYRGPAVCDRWWAGGQQLCTEVVSESVDGCLNETVEVLIRRSLNEMLPSNSYLNR